MLNQPSSIIIIIFKLPSTIPIPSIVTIAGHETSVELAERLRSRSKKDMYFDGRRDRGRALETKATTKTQDIKNITKSENKNEPSRHPRDHAIKG